MHDGNSTDVGRQTLAGKQLFTACHLMLKQVNDNVIRYKSLALMRVPAYS